MQANVKMQSLATSLLLDSGLDIPSFRLQAEGSSGDRILAEKAHHDALLGYQITALCEALDPTDRGTRSARIQETTKASVNRHRRFAKDVENNHLQTSVTSATNWPVSSAGTQGSATPR